MKKGDGCDLAPGALDTVPQHLQLKAHESFAPGYIAIGTPFRLVAGEGRDEPLFATPPDWTEQADCHGMWSIFDKPDWATFTRKVTPICDGCPVKDTCLSEALTEELGEPLKVRSGVRGGLRPHDRLKLHREQPDCARCGDTEAPRVYESGVCGPCTRELRGAQCVNGHEKTGDNLHIIPTTGKRVCRICYEVNRKGQRARRRERERLARLAS